MILEKVELTNYRSHRDTKLDFPLACVISGSVGSGKSSLQESLRLAAFGETDSKDPRGHIGLGADRCRVLWQFRMLDGRRYRIVLSQSVHGDRIKTDLQLTSGDANGKWTPISGRSVPETRAKIVEILGCDYDTITSSAICPQGLSSKFTQPPKLYIDGRYYEGRAARLMIFAQSEGLGVWEDRRKAAVKTAGILEVQAGVLEKQANEGAAASATVGAARSSRQRAEEAVEHAARRIGEIEGILEGIRRDIQTLTARIAETTATAEAYRAEVATLAGDEAQLTVKQTKASRYRDILAHRAEIEAKASESEALKERADALRQELAAIEAEIKGLTAEQGLAADRVIAAASRASQLRVRIAALQERLAAKPALELRISRLAVAKAEVVGLSARIHVLDEHLASTQACLDTLTKAHLAAEEVRGRILGEEKRIQAEAEGLLPLIRGHQGRVAVLSTVPCIGVGELPDLCPLLREAKLSEHQLATLLPKHEVLTAWVRPALPEVEPRGRLDAELLGLRQEKSQAQFAMKALENEIVRLTPAEAELASLTTLSQGLSDLEEESRQAIALEISEVHAAFGVGEALKGAGGRSAEERKCLADVEASLIGLSRWASVLPELGIAEIEMATLVPEIQRLESRIAGLQERAAMAEKVIDGLGAEEANLTGLRLAEEQYALDLAEIRKMERAATKTLADATAEIRRLESEVTKAAKASEEAKALRTRHARLTTLALAYKQIPIMIIETQAVPQVELEANRVLARISRNGMRTELRTLREVKSRDELADGLDIIITDRRGQRSYEDYSGGQKFQVDLAYRVALSRRQSHRSGGGIGCLWVDEGWGTQDSGSLETLVEALRDLSGEIPQLLVTSHVEALKDTFPVRVEVSGGPEASVVRVVGG